MTRSRTLNRPLIASLSIHIIIALICWFIVIKPPKQIQRLIEINLIELPQFKVQEQPILPPPRIKPIRPKMVRTETKTIIPQQIQVKQNYQEPYRTKQIVEKPIKVETSRPIFISPPTDRVRIEEKPDISLPVAHLDAPKEMVREKYPSAIVPAVPLPFLPAKGSSVEITGITRRVKHRTMFKLPKWVEEKGISMNGSIKFWVSPDGSIDRVEIFKTFGYADIDSLACSAVYKWRFEELPEEQGEKNDCGIVKFRVQLN